MLAIQPANSLQNQVFNIATTVITDTLSFVSILLTLQGVYRNLDILILIYD